MPKRNRHEGREVVEVPALSRRYSKIAGKRVEVFEDWLPRGGKIFLLFMNGKFIMRIRNDDSYHRAWVREHFRKMSGDWYRKEGKAKAVKEANRERVVREEILADFHDEVGRIADYTIVKRPVTIVL